MGLFAIPERGFVSLWPYADLGHDKAVALYSVGCRKDKLPVAVKGYAVVIANPTPGGAQAVVRRLKSYWASNARMEAIHAAQGRPAVLLKAIGRGRVMVWERIESIQAMTDDQAEPIAQAKQIRPDGELIEKANPRNVTAISQFTNNLATTVTHELSKAVRKPLKQFVTELTNLQGRQFEDLSTRQFNNIWQQASTSLMGEVQAGYGLAAPQVTQKIQFAVKDIALKNKNFLKNTYMPKLSGSFLQPDFQAIEQIGTQGGFWIRDHAGQISDKLSKDGRDIIQEGLKQGQGRDEIGQMLTEKLPDIWGKMGFNYARVVAANAVSRARSYSEVSSYASVGISYMEIVAMLDERTTDICRTLDGMVIEVQSAMAHQQQIAGLTNPKDIRQVAPFLTEKTDKKTGEKHVNIGKSRYATISRSGKGAVDDRGAFARHISNKKMMANGVSMPPYHHNCRTMTVARVEMVQVPQKYEPHTTPVASTNDEKPPKKPKVSKPKPKPQQRPVTMKPIPVPKKPVYAGQKKMYDPPVKKKPGASPKKTAQLPPQDGPQNLKQYNAAAKDQMASAYGKKVKIVDIDYAPGVGALKYTYENPEMGGALATWHMKVPPSQNKKMAAAMKARIRRQDKKILAASKKMPPKTKAHAHGNMKRSVISSRHANLADAEQAKRNKNFDQLERDKRINSELTKDPDFRDFSRRHKVTPGKFRERIQQKWEATSRDENLEMHYYQLAVQQEFDLPKATLAPLRPAIVQKIQGSASYGKNIKAYRALARVQYNETQATLKKHGIKKITLFRGYDVDTKAYAPKGATFSNQLQDVAVTNQPLSSYSTSASKAHDFSTSGPHSVMIKQEVPASRIFGSYESGIGTNYETEFVVIGGQDDFAESVNWSRYKSSTNEKDVLNKLFGGR